MMCSRGQPPHIRASTYQYSPKLLLYQQGTQWHDGNYDSLTRRLAELMPPHLHQAFRILAYGTREAVRTHEPFLSPVVQWIEDHGRGHGFRIPHALERARATGRAAYLEQLRAR